MGLTLSELHAELPKWAHLSVSGRLFTRKALGAMYDRRAATGFPECDGGTKIQPHGRPAMTWDSGEVIAWYLEWLPRNAGRPPAWDRETCHGCGRPMPGVQRPDKRTGDNDARP